MQPQFRTPLLACAIPAIVLVVLCGLFAVAGMLFVAQANPDIATAKMRLARSERGRFSIQYPEGMFFTEAPWNGIEKSPDPTTLVAIINTFGFQRYGTAVEFRRGNGSSNSLDDVSQWGERINRTREKYTLISIQRYVVNGEETMLREYTATVYVPEFFAGNRSIHCFDNYRFHDRGYILTFCTDADDFARLKPTFVKMMETYAYLD